MASGLDTSNVGETLLAVGADDDIAVVDGSRNYTYAELRHAAGRILHELTTLGIRPGARVGILGTNSFFWIAGYLAALKLGVAVPLSDRNGPADLAAQVDWVDCDAVLLDRRQQRRVGAALGERRVVTDAVLAEEGEVAWPATATPADADAALMFTSGTTARPKAVRLSHANLLANTASILGYLGLTRSDRMLVILPFSYCYGASLLHTHLAVGGSVVLCNTFTFPETAVDLMARHDCTGLAGVPSSFQLLLRTSSYATRPLPSLRLVQQAGGRLPPAQILELAAAQPQSRLFVMYGQTEATARLSYLPPELLADKVGSIGRGVQGVTLAVLDEAGNPVAPGEQGEIVATGPSIARGYVNDPEQTAEKFPGGSLRTGDLATVDAEGFIYITGRRADFIKSWGFRISPQQVEEAALDFPELAAAAVVGLPDAEAGEAVVLAAVAMPGAALDADALLAHLRSKLPKHMVPESVHVLDALPMTGSGKVARPQLRDLLESLRAQVP